MIDDIRVDVAQAVVAVHVPPQSPAELWNLDALEEALRKDFALSLPIRQWAEEDNQLDDKKIAAKIVEALSLTYADKKAKIGDAVLEVRERITRCNATKVDVTTGRISGDTLAALQAGYVHQDFGIYAVVTEGGPIALGQEIEVI